MDSLFSFICIFACFMHLRAHLGPWVYGHILALVTPHDCLGSLGSTSPLCLMLAAPGGEGGVGCQGHPCMIETKLASQGLCSWAGGDFLISKREPLGCLIAQAPLGRLGRGLRVAEMSCLEPHPESQDLLVSPSASQHRAGSGQQGCARKCLRDLGVPGFQRAPSW